MGKKVLKNIYCVIIHGVEPKEISGDYADKFFNGVKENLCARGQVFFYPYNWSGLVHDRQMQAFNSMDKGLGWEKFRKLKHTIVSDLLWYARTKDETAQNDTFRQIHAGIDRTINDMILAHGNRDFKVVLIGHSLGSQIALGHCFESVHKDNILGIITMGSPIGMYSGMFEDWGHLPDCLNKEGTFWLNFWNFFDPVCSKLQTHPSKQIGSFVEDFRVETLNPLKIPMLQAHSVYWGHDKTQKKIAEKLDSLFR